MRATKRALLPAAMATLATMALLLLTMATVSANGAGAVSFTQNFHNATETDVDANPCTGVPGTVTLTYDGVFHVTELTSGIGAGTDWATGTMTGDFSFVPFDSSQPSYTGHFTSWFGENDNLHNGTATSTFMIHGTGSDGSTIQFHEVDHLSVSATGVTVSFDKPTCG